jgi:chaperonin GroES
MTGIGIRPIGDRIIVKVADRPDTSPGGIYIPPTVESDGHLEAVVIETGPGRTLENGTETEFNVTAGDRVIITKYGGTEIFISGKKYLIITEDNILAIRD